MALHLGGEAQRVMVAQMQWQDMTAQVRRAMHCTQQSTTLFLSLTLPLDRHHNPNPSRNPNADPNPHPKLNSSPMCINAL